MGLFRGAPALIVLICAQVGLYLVFSALFAPHPRHVWRRRALAVVLIALALVLPLTLAGARRGIEVPGPWRGLLLEPLLALQIFAIPLLVVLGALLSLARRLRPVPPLRLPEPAEAAVASPLQPAAEPAQSAAERERAAAEREHAAAAEREHAAQAIAAAAPPPLSEPRRIFLARAATALFAGTAGLAALAVDEAELEPELTRHEVVLPGLAKDLEGLTILQLSDIHAGSLMTEPRMERIARAAAAVGADVVVFTGDLIDLSARAAAPFARAFSTLHGKLGTFAILGNHDYYAGFKASEAAVRESGAVLLRNTGARIVRGSGSLWLGGVDDPVSRSVDPVRALSGAMPGETRIMLAHRPGLFDLCAQAGAQLTLSGHTHGGQLAFSPRFSLARLIGPYTMGFYKQAGAQLFVHRGMGTVGAAPVRLGSPPEIALLTLRGS